MHTKQVAERAGVNTETLRYYERRGLLPEPPRSAAGYREYPTSAVTVLRFVKRAQTLGFTLDEVEELLHLADGGPENCEHARHLAATHITELDTKIAELQRMRAALAALTASCDSPRQDRDCPLLDAIQHDDQSITEVPR